MFRHQSPRVLKALKSANYRPLPGFDLFIRKKQIRLTHAHNNFPSKGELPLKKQLTEKRSSDKGIEPLSRQVNNFLPFFQEVDAYMAKDILEGFPNSQTSNGAVSGLSSPSVASIEAEKAFVIPTRRPIVEGLSASLMPPPLPKSLKWDEESYLQYVEILNKLTIVDKISSVGAKNWLLCKDDDNIQYHLPELSKIVKEGLAPTKENLSLMDEVGRQRIKFRLQFDVSDEDYNQLQFILVLVGRICAKAGAALPLAVAWEKVKESGISFGRDDLNTYLYVTTTYGAKPIPEDSIASIFQGTDFISSDAAAELESKASIEINVAEEIAAFYDALFESSEQSLSIRIKTLVHKGKLKEAEALLEISNVENLRLRTFQPLLKEYLDSRNFPSALALFQRMRSIPSVLIEAETFVQIIAGLMENGYFRTDSPPIGGITDLGFKSVSGPGLLHELMTLLSENSLEITPGLAKRLNTAVYRGFKDFESSTGEKLEELHPLAPLQLCGTVAGPDDIIANRVKIDSKTGLCKTTGSRLKLIKLTDSQRKELQNGIIQLSAVQKAQYEKKQIYPQDKSKKRPSEQREQELSKFVSWLNTRSGKPYTVIVDGANVGYYLQNFESGKFNFHQIQFMVDTLERMNEHPLVIIPLRYTQRSFHLHTLSVDFLQVQNRQEKQILDNLFKAGKIYVIPKGLQDDHFWMLASISDQLTSRQGQSLDVPFDDPYHRWPGTRPLLVSNDQMRDHRLELVKPRLFRRWYSSHIVNYNFTGFVDNRSINQEISFSPADCFSREMMKDITDDGHVVWHIPVSDWESDERFCLRIPK